MPLRHYSHNWSNQTQQRSLTTQYVNWSSKQLGILPTKKKATAMTAMLACFPFVRLFLGHLTVHPWKLTFWSPKSWSFWFSFPFHTAIYQVNQPLHAWIIDIMNLKNRQNPKRKLAFQNSPEKLTSPLKRDHFLKEISSSKPQFSGSQDVIFQGLPSSKLTQLREIHHLKMYLCISYWKRRMSSQHNHGT